MQLPTVITECLEYRESTEEERAAFARRVRDVLEFAESLAGGGRRKEFPNFFRFVEDLELDVSHLQEFMLPWGGALSRWLVHNCWTFDTTPAEMRATLSSQMADLINASEPSIDAGVESTERWLSDLGKGLLSAVNAFANATDFSVAMAHWVAVDILLGRILSACYRLRLNALVPR